jgi:hypothetical protein
MTTLNGEQYSRRIGRIAASLDDPGMRRAGENDDRLKRLHALRNELQLIRKEIGSELVARGLKPPFKCIAAFFDFLMRSYRYLFKQELLIGLAIKGRLLRDPVIRVYRQAQLEADIALADIRAMRHRIEYSDEPGRKGD